MLFIIILIAKGNQSKTLLGGKIKIILLTLKEFTFKKVLSTLILPSVKSYQYFSLKICGLIQFLNEKLISFQFFFVINLKIWQSCTYSYFQLSSYLNRLKCVFLMLYGYYFHNCLTNGYLFYIVWIIWK